MTVNLLKFQDPYFVYFSITYKAVMATYNAKLLEEIEGK